MDELTRCGAQSAGGANLVGECAMQSPNVFAAPPRGAPFAQAQVTAPSGGVAFAAQLASAQSGSPQAAASSGATCCAAGIDPLPTQSQSPDGADAVVMEATDAGVQPGNQAVPAAAPHLHCKQAPVWTGAIGEIGADLSSTDEDDVADVTGLNGGPAQDTGLNPATATSLPSIGASVNGSAGQGLPPGAAGGLGGGAATEGLGDHDGQIARRVETNAGTALTLAAATGLDGGASTPTGRAGVAGLATASGPVPFGAPAGLSATTNSLSEADAPAAMGGVSASRAVAADISMESSGRSPDAVTRWATGTQEPGPNLPAGSLRPGITSATGRGSQGEPDMRPGFASGRGADVGPALPPIMPDAGAPIAPPPSLIPPQPLAGVTQPSESGGSLASAMPPLSTERGTLADQVTPAMISLSRAASGEHRMTLRLDPAELGHLEIRIERSAEAPARVSITVERAETLTLLLRDQARLEQALDQAGIPAAGRHVTFQVAPAEVAAAPHTPPQDTPGRWSGGSLAGDPSAQQGAGQHATGHESTGTPNRQSRFAAAGPDQPDLAYPGAPPGAWMRAGLDITA